VTDLSFEVREASGSARLILRGELDMASAAAADSALLDLLGRGFDRVILDLRELDFMDSTGVKFLIDGRDAASELGVKIAIAYEGDAVERILTVSGVATLFERQDDDGASRP
jgi:anti-sigma B factor antagonist